MTAKIKTLEEEKETQVSEVRGIGFLSEVGENSSVVVEKRILSVVGEDQQLGNLRPITMYVQRFRAM